MTLKQLFLALTVCLSVSAATAQDLRKSGSVYGKVESNGDVRINGSIRGKFEQNGDIRVNGSIKGRIESNGDIVKTAL